MTTTLEKRIRIKLDHSKETVSESLGLEDGRLESMVDELIKLVDQEECYSKVIEILFNTKENEELVASLLALGVVLEVWKDDKEIKRLPYIY